MRPGQNKRSRGRNGGGGGGGGGGPHYNRPRLPQRTQTFDSNGPSVKIRGNAYQVFERYVAMAREAQASGDRVAAENFYQHAEHYFHHECVGRGPRPGPAPADNPGGSRNGRRRQRAARGRGGASPVHGAALGSLPRRRAAPVLLSGRQRVSVEY